MHRVAERLDPSLGAGSLGCWLLGVPAPPSENPAAWLGHGDTEQETDDARDFGSCGLLAGVPGSPRFLPHLGGEWSPKPRTCCPLPWPPLVVPTGYERLHHCPMSHIEVVALWHSWRGIWGLEGGCHGLEGAHLLLQDVLQPG